MLKKRNTENYDKPAHEILVMQKKLFFSLFL